MKNYMTTRVCEVCGTPFPFNACPSNLALGRGRFHSKDCQKSWQTIPLEKRFQKYVGPKTDAGCVLWIGTTNADGYGVIGSGTSKGRMILAHRASYEIHVGLIPPGIFILHSCDNPPCVNPAHLSLGNQADNIADMLSKGRQRKRVPGSRRFLQEQRRANG
jgi:hypothetical protein